MSKASKYRLCPALQREIPSWECGEHRNSRFVCTAECAHNPFAPRNYSALLELEREVDGRALKRLVTEPGSSARVREELERLFDQEEHEKASAFVHCSLFFTRDAQGLTMAQQWEKAGFPELKKNDSRALFKARMQMRIVLFEVRRVLNPEQIEVIDLLEPDASPQIVMDRGAAGSAVRFSTILGWAYPLPHFWRLSGTATKIPELGQFDPVEIVLEIVRHLGGPREIPEVRRWLAEHFLHFCAALDAAARARREQMFASIDAKFGKAIYRVTRPFHECRQRLDSAPAISPDPLSESERDEGFSEARVWLEEGPSLAIGIGRESGGRVLLGQSFWRLEAMGAERLAALRKNFESLMGDAISFTGERLDDLAARLGAREPGYDRALVPPALLEQAQKILISTSRLPLLSAAERVEDLEQKMELEQDKMFLRDSIPALDDRTPREAAADPQLRPRLIRLMKARIRGTDERNLATGRSYDVNWLVRELGLTEILVEAPPPRPIPPDLQPKSQQPSEASAPLVRAMPLPSEPLSLDEALIRMRKGQECFASHEEMLDSIDANSSIIEAAQDVTAQVMKERDFGLFLTVLPSVWFCFVRPGTPGPDLGTTELGEALEEEFQSAALLQSADARALLELLLSGCAQPFVFQLSSAMLVENINALKKKHQPRGDVQLFLLVLIKVIVNKLHEHLAEQSS